jgi:predicted permease
MWSDSRDVARSLLRRPYATLTVAGTFACGLAVNIAVFSVIDRIMFRPLTYAKPERLVHVHSLRRSAASPEMFLPEVVRPALATRVRSFEQVAYAEGNVPPLSVAELGSPLQLDIASHNLLRVLGVVPQVGRDFEEDDILSPERAILLSDAAWQRRAGRSPDVLSKTFGAGRERYRVIGILPEDFLVPSSRPGDVSDGILLDREAANAPFALDIGAPAVARLRDGVTLQQASAELDAIVQQLRRENPRADRILRVALQVQPIGSGLFSLYRPFARLIVIAGIAALLVAWVNVTTLLLAQGRTRERELAIRLALGASFATLLRIRIGEALLLCCIGAAMAVLACGWGFRGILAIVPAGIRGVSASPFEARTLVATFVAAFGFAMTAGFVSAWRLRRVDVMVVLRRTAGGLHPKLRIGALLVAVQSALAVALTSAAVAAAWSFFGMTFRSAGFVVQDLYLLSVSHGGSGPAKMDPVPRMRVLLDTLRVAPGVAAAAVVSGPVIGEGAVEGSFWHARLESGAVWGVSAGVFETLRTPILSGRAFTETEVGANAPVALLNKLGAARLWPGQPVEAAVGKEVDVGSERRAVVGVVSDINRRPGEAPMPSLFVPITAPEGAASQSRATVLLRMESGQRPSIQTIDEQLTRDLGRGRLSMEPVAVAREPWLERPRFQAALFGSFAVVCLVLTLVGVYALSALDLAQRRFELGLRASFGATTDQLRSVIFRTTLVPVLCGGIAGLILAWWAGRVLQSFVFDVNARDPLLLGLASLVSAMVALAAGWLPARRAAHVDAVDVLRRQ